MSRYSSELVVDIASGQATLSHFPTPRAAHGDVPSTARFTLSTVQLDALQRFLDTKWHRVHKYEQQGIMDAQSYCAEYAGRRVCAYGVDNAFPPAWRELHALAPTNSPADSRRRGGGCFGGPRRATGADIGSTRTLRYSLSGGIAGLSDETVIDLASGLVHVASSVTTPPRTFMLGAEHLHALRDFLRRHWASMRPVRSQGADMFEHCVEYADRRVCATDDDNLPPAWRDLLKLIPTRADNGLRFGGAAAPSPAGIARASTGAQLMVTNRLARAGRQGTSPDPLPLYGAIYKEVVRDGKTYAERFDPLPQTMGGTGEPLELPPGVAVSFRRPDVTLSERVANARYGLNRVLLVSHDLAALTVSTYVSAKTMAESVVGRIVVGSDSGARDLVAVHELTARLPAIPARVPLYPLVHADGAVLPLLAPGPEAAYYAGDRWTLALVTPQTPIAFSHSPWGLWYGGLSPGGGGPRHCGEEQFAPAASTGGGVRTAGADLGTAADAAAAERATPRNLLVLWNRLAPAGAEEMGGAWKTAALYGALYVERATGSVRVYGPVQLEYGKPTSLFMPQLGGAREHAAALVGSVNRVLLVSHVESELRERFDVKQARLVTAPTRVPVGSSDGPRELVAIHSVVPTDPGVPARVAVYPQAAGERLLPAAAAAGLEIVLAGRGEHWEIATCHSRMGVQFSVWGWMT